MWWTVFEVPVAYAKIEDDWRTKVGNLLLIPFGILQDGMDDPDITEAELLETQRICHRDVGPWLPDVDLLFRRTPFYQKMLREASRKSKLPCRMSTKKSSKHHDCCKAKRLPKSGLLHRLCSRPPQPKHPHLRPDGTRGLSIFCFSFIKAFWFLTGIHPF